jgi:hypothetical protein
MQICAITNVYNESFNLPIWLRYYGKQLGSNNCIIVDHASTDGSTATLNGAGHIYLPSGPFDDVQRSERMTAFANAMLKIYDVVIYTDCDEILVPDPRQYASLREFCERNDGECATAIGLELLHNLTYEKPFEADKDVLAQRKYVRFAAPFCKTLLVRKNVEWSGGFHASSFAPRFGGLYLFHLRWVDLGECLRRLAITRDIPRANPRQASHHLEPFVQYVDRFRRFADLKVEIDERFEFNEYLAEVMTTTTRADNGLYYIGTKIRSKELYVVPESFVGVF